MATASKKGKRPALGRPPLPPDKRKRPSMGFRPTADLRGKLEHAAATSGLSLTQEIERRLERSFAEEKSQASISAEAVGGVYASFGTIGTFTVMRLLANAINAIETTSGVRWTDNKDIFNQVKFACSTILEIFRPHGQKNQAMFAEGFKITEADHLGTETAISVAKVWLDRTALIDALRAPAESPDANQD